jgi:hypothetical protein
MGVSQIEEVGMRSLGHIGVEEWVMFWDASAINGYAADASGGGAGTVSDVLFEDGGQVIQRLILDHAKPLLMNPFSLDRLSRGFK